MFAAFREIAPNRLREQVGLAFEDFAPGQIFHHRPGITITQQDNISESLATLNQAMIHYDEHYAAQTEFKHPLVVSSLTLQRAVGMAWKTFGRRRRILRFHAIRMTAPVFGGDTLYARSLIGAVAAAPDDPDCGQLSVETTLSNAKSVDVAVISYDQLIYRRGRGPFAALGY
jgi:itaconyl-CoA hydratase